jgi:anthranilate phosphoribosyltransferase
MQSLIADLQSSADLTAEQVEFAVAHLVSEKVADEDKSEFLKKLHEKGESAQEIAAFARSMLARAVDPQIDPEKVDGPILDVCGTGGDKLELFNVSTAAMFVLAAGGVAVVKHGNRAVTSKCGGADVLDELGVSLDLSPAQLRECVERHNVAFVFAPAYHPAFKAVNPVRRALAAQGIQTVFNLLGPILNPVRPAYQLVGLYAPVLLPKYAEVLSVLGRARAWVVHGSGMDELSLCGPSEVHEVIDGTVQEFRVDPRDIGLHFCEMEQLRGGNRAHNARILLDILEGEERGPRRDLVLLNAAAGFVITGLSADLAAGYDRAKEQIASGRARAKLDALRSAV